MKKYIKFGWAIAAILVIAIGTSSMTREHGAHCAASHSTEQSDCNHGIGHVSHDSDDLECPSCGGRLTYSYKLFPKKVDCPVCKGKGKIGQGKYESTCNNCKGTGKDTVYEGGYKCKSCDYKRKD